MPHRGQETVIRVLRLWRWRDILRRTRPTRVYPYCARPLNSYTGMQSTDTIGAPESCTNPISFANSRL